MFLRLAVMAMVLLGPPGVTMTSPLAEREHEEAASAVEARDWLMHRDMVQPPPPAPSERFTRRHRRLRLRPVRRLPARQRRRRPSRRVSRCVLYADNDDPDPEA